jgi:hypothetical protein
LVIGTNVEAWSANLDTWSGKTPYAGVLTVTTGKTFNVTNTLTFSGTDSSVLNIGSGGTLGSNAYTSTAYVPQTTTVNGHALSGNVTVTPTDLSLVIGTNTEAWSAELDALAALTYVSLSFVKMTGAGTFALDTATYVPTTTTVAGTALSGNVTQDQITGLSTTGLVKRTGANTLAIATSATDYAPATSGSAILYASSGGFGNVGYVGGSLGFSGGNLTLSGDSAAPGNSYFYGTNSSGTKGWYVQAGSGTTTNSLTINSSGSGGASPQTFNGASAITISYNTIGAQPLATNLTSLAGLTYASTSFVKMTGAGTFALDTNTYLTGNQSITLSGNVTGSGTTTITTTIAASAVTLAMMANETAYTLLGNATSSAAAPSALSSGIYLGTGSLPYTDTGVGLYQWASVTGYAQNLLLNTSNNAGASVDFIVGNNLSTASTYYGDFGQNSSTFTGSGSLNLPSAVYLYSQTGDLVLGTGTSNAIHLVVNSGATDALTISSGGTFTFPAFTTAGLLTNTPLGVLTSLTNASSVNSTLMGILGTGWSNSASLVLSAAGTWVAPSGSGNVSNAGTPVSGQVAVWTNATTVSGYTGFTSDSSGNISVNSIISAGVATFQSGLVITTNTKTGNYTLASTDFDVAFTGSSASTFTMPSSPSAGMWYMVTNMGTAVLTLSSTNNFYTTLPGQPTVTLNPGDSADLIYINGTWKVQ